MQVVCADIGIAAITSEVIELAHAYGSIEP